MPKREALRQRIELVESRILGVAVKVLNLRMRSGYALADIQVNGMHWANRRYCYSQFFKLSQLR